MSLLSDIYKALRQATKDIGGLHQRLARLETKGAGVGYTEKRLTPDNAGIYTIIEWWTNDATPKLIRRSTLSNQTGTPLAYRTRTDVVYKRDGTTVYQTRTYTISYATNGDLITSTLTTVA